MRECGECGTAFEPVSKQHKYCSTLCKERARYRRDRDKTLARRREMYAENADHRETILERNRQWRANNPDKVQGYNEAKKHRTTGNGEQLRIIG